MNWRRMIFPWQRKPAAEPEPAAAAVPAEPEPAAGGLPVQRRWSNPRALTDDQVREVRRRNAAGESQNALAKEFGISQPSMRAVCLRETYRDVD